MENRYDIGVDPDSNTHGLALYINKNLVSLHKFNLMQLYEFRSKALFIDGQELLYGQPVINWHVEDVTKNNAIFAKHLTKNPNANYAIARKVGKLQQSAIELHQLIEYFFPNDIINLHPISSQWKNKQGKIIFEKCTGWVKQSNEDTRSAAYFGFLGL